MSDDKSTEQNVLPKRVTAEEHGKLPDAVQPYYQQTDNGQHFNLREGGEPSGLEVAHQRAKRENEKLSGQLEETQSQLTTMQQKLEKLEADATSRKKSAQAGADHDAAEARAKQMFAEMVPEHETLVTRLRKERDEAVEQVSTVKADTLRDRLEAQLTTELLANGVMADALRAGIALAEKDGFNNITGEGDSARAVALVDDKAKQAAGGGDLTIADWLQLGEKSFLFPQKGGTGTRTNGLKGGGGARKRYIADMDRAEKDKLISEVGIDRFGTMAAEQAAERTRAQVEQRRQGRQTVSQIRQHG